VKGWSEVYHRPIASVSRLEALAVQTDGDAPWVAAFFDAQRGQVFGSLYRRVGGSLKRIEEEVVIAPGLFLEWVAHHTKGGRVGWISMDPHVLTAEAFWTAREKAGEKVQAAPSVLAPMIGRIGFERLAAGQTTDALLLDANYVRRSDAEIFWKGNK
jgi:tRNA threonylcarbamoyladenosine biosynthesis protein TsaB